MRPSSISTRQRIWWSRDFLGNADQVREARHWIADLLPHCNPRADVLLLASELCANAVIHTRSGQPHGWFTVVVEWTDELARVVIEDQGSAKTPMIGARAGDLAREHESGRGLRLVDGVADSWGTASRPGSRWVWADVLWEANGGPPRAALDDASAPVLCSNERSRQL
jgi:anti-sigma regulatory factor (Ser/Thr protein kinase)